MSEPARRWRVLAAVGLALAMAQGRAWGQESIWTKAADVVRRVQELPFILPPLPDEDKSSDAIEFSSEVRTVIRMVRSRLQSSSPPPIFAWEKTDDATWHIDVGGFLETIHEDQWAYIHYKTLSDLYPGKQALAAAVQRVKARYLETHPPAGMAWGGVWDFCEDVDELDKAFSRWSPAEPHAPPAVSSDLLPRYDAEHSDGPISDDPALFDEEVEPCSSGYSLWCRRTRFDTSLFQSVVPKDRTFLMFSQSTTSSTTVSALPQRKDMLPDSEHGRLLIDLGVITDPHYLLALPEPVTPVYFDGLCLPGRIMF
jgi:hypothetical protein